MANHFATINPSLTKRLESARRHLDAGRVVDAEADFRILLSIEFAEASEETITALQSLLRLALDLGDAFCQRSEEFLLADQVDDGLLAQECAQALSGEIARLHERLGDAYLRLWDFKNAIAAFRNALRLQPGSEALEKKLQDAIDQQNQPEHVLASCREAVARSANSPAAHLRLANALRAYRMLDDAIAEYQRVIELEPDSAIAHNNLAVALKDCGRVEEALDKLRRAAGLSPESNVIQSNLLYTYNFHPSDDRQIIVKAHRESHDQIQRSNSLSPVLWGEGRGEGSDVSGVELHPSPYVVDPSPRSTGERESDQNRPLRIGYVSPDFCDHCQSFFTVPLLRSHDSARFEIYCYADVSRRDVVTDRLRDHAKVWRDTLGLSDERMSDLIRSDRIDILVDLTMHMANNRQMMFARKPAPIQITWLAYPGTTGQTAIDYRISDPFLDPPADGDPGYSEQTLRLPETFWCYDPLRAPEPIGPPPVQRNGFITFGCLNNYCKVNDRTLGMWGEVLRRLPNSRFILLAPSGESCRRALKALDVEEWRIEFVDYRPRDDYLKLYHRIDICLDTFPYNGHTTSLDALWMGVPVVSRCGKTPASRGGFSQASNLSLTHLVGQSVDAFVQTAVNLANNPDQLAGLRSRLRERMTASPLMDAPRFARNLEDLYRAVWGKSVSGSAR